MASFLYPLLREALIVMAAHGPCRYCPHALSLHYAGIECACLECLIDA